MIPKYQWNEPDDFSILKNAKDCLIRCNLTPRCKFWDYAAVRWNWGKTCRLRSDNGVGPKNASDTSEYGAKNCDYSKFTILRPLTMGVRDTS